MIEETDDPRPRPGNKLPCARREPRRQKMGDHAAPEPHGLARELDHERGFQRGAAWCDLRERKPKGEQG